MGICLVAYAVSPANLALIQADPPLVWRVLEPEDEAAYLRQLAADNRPSLLQRWFGRTQAPPSPRALTFGDGELSVLDMDKAWDGVRVCIKQCAPSAPDLLAGDGQIGQFEVGYGPALYVASGTVARFAAAVDGISEDALLGAFGSVEFTDVYLADLWKRQDGDARSYLLENFLELQGFARHCAAHGHAAVLQFT